MSRAAIPPSKSYKISNGKTVKALEEKLNAAEMETLNLVRQLEHIGFDCSQGDHGSKDLKPLSPFIAKTGDAEILQRNYETLVSRVCRNESTLQTLKLNLCNLQAQNQLKIEQAQSSKENLMSITETYEKEKKKLVKDLATARKESKENLAKRHDAEEAKRRLSAALEQAVQIKAKLALDFEDLRNGKQKLNKHLAETREDLARELTLRSSLEQSHNALMERLQHLEITAQEGRKEIESFSKSCALLKDEGIKISKEKKLIQIALENSRLEIATKEKQMIKQIEEMQVFLTSLEHLKKENEALKTQLDELTKHTHSMKSALESTEKEKQALLNRLEHCESIQLEAVENEQQRSKDIIQNIKDHLEKQIEKEQNVLKENEQLKLLLEENKDEHHKQQEIYAEKIKTLEESIKVAHDELEANRKDKDLVIEDKQSLLDEVNLAVDGMSAEHSRMQQELEGAKLEVTTITNEKCHLQLEVDKLLDRISFLEQQQSSQKTVESSLVDLTESKNKLAYENGRLQSQLQHLQQQIEAITDARSEVIQLKRTNAALQSKVTSLSSALSEANVNQKKLENKLKQLIAAEQKMEVDLKQMTRSRNEAVDSNQKYQQQIKTLDHQQHGSLQHLENKLKTAKQNNAKMAETIKSVMQSHSKLQLVLEKLQTELGKKDAEILALETGKHKYEESLKLLSGDMLVLQDQLVSMETNQLDRVAPLKTELETERREKRKLLSSIDKLNESNKSLQNRLEKIEVDLEAKNSQIKQLQQTRKREKDIAAKNQHMYEEKIEKLELDAEAENEREKKQASKEVNRLRQANHSSQMKITELMSTCEQQLVQIQELEERNNKQKQRIMGQKTQLLQFHSKSKESQATNQRIEEMSKELEELEQVRNQYMSKNSEQMQTIATFLTQISDLQREMRNVVNGQSNAQERLRHKEDQLKAERKLRLEIQRKYKLAEEELIKLQDKNEKANEDIRNLSLQMSQQTLSRLAEYSKDDHLHGNQFLEIQDQLQKELDHSRLMDKRMVRIMNSSSRFVEDLALDLDESGIRY